MASSLIGALRVSLGLDSAQFEAGTKRARSVAQRDAAAIQKSLSGIKSSFDNLRNAAVTTAFVAAAKRALDYASSLGEVAQQVGVTTAELQEYRYAASQAGISSDEMDAALAKLTRSMGEARAGSKSQVAAFRELGVSLQDASGRAYTAGEVIPKLAQGFAKIEDPASRARLQVDLFGKSGQKLDTLLAGGAGGINELRDAAHRLGIVLSDNEIQKADETADKLAEVKQVLEARLAGTVAANTDAILTMADALMTVANAAGTAINWMGSFIKSGQQAVLAAKGWTIFGNPAAGDAATAARWKYSLNNQFAAIEEMGRKGTGKKPVPVLPDGAMPVATGGGQRKRGGSGGGGRDRTAEYLERFKSEMGSLLDRELSLQQDLTSDVEARWKIEQLRIHNEQQAYEEQLKQRQKDGELTEAQARELQIQNQKVMDAQRGVETQRRDIELNRQSLELASNLIELDNDRLSAELDAARTQGERRRIQLEMLDNEQKLARLSLEAVRDAQDSSEADKENARRKLARLDAERSEKASEIKRDTMGPLEQWRSEGAQTAAEMREAFENITVDALNSSLDLATRNMFKLKGAAGELMNQILSDVIRLQLRSMMSGQGGLLGGIVSAIGGLFGGGKIGGAVPAGWGDTSVLGGAIDWNAMTAGINLPRLATGGTFMAGGISGVDRNVLAINGIPKVRVSANERVTVSPAGQGGAPIVIQMYSEEGPALVHRVSAISDGVTMQNMTRSAAYSARAGRQSLARG